MKENPYDDAAANAWINAPKAQYEQGTPKEPSAKVSLLLPQSHYLRIMQERLPAKQGSKHGKQGNAVAYTLSDYLRELVANDLAKSQE